MLPKEKKIVGYVLSKHEYLNAANQITSLIHADFSFGIHSTTYDAFKKAGVLDLWFEPIYEIEKYIGWYYFKDNDPSDPSYEYLVKLNGNTIDHNMLYYDYCFTIRIEDNKVNIFNDNAIYINRLVRLATNNDKVRILSLVSKHKGYKEGTLIFPVSTIHINNKVKINDEFIIFKDDNKKEYLNSNGYRVFDLDTCQWAEIIENTLPKFDNYEGKILNNSSIVYGCNEQYKYQIEQVINLKHQMNVMNITSFIHETGYKITIEHLDQILKCFK